MRAGKVAIIWAFAASVMSIPVASQAEPGSAEIAAYREADQNHDKHLSVAEFNQFVELIASAGNENGRLILFFGAHRTAFAMMDLNRDSLISPAELVQAETWKPNR